MSKSLLPSGVGGNRRTFESMISQLADAFEEDVEERYIKEMELLLTDIIDHTPIDTGASAGVTFNSVSKGVVRPLIKNRYAQGKNIGNNPGDTGWQIEVDQSARGLKIAIVNPMWNPYLKFLEFGVVEPVSPAKPHFVSDAWMRWKQSLKDRL